MKRILLLGALLLSTLLGFSCDQCGCGIMLGVQPFDHANNFGLQYRMRYLQGDLLTALPLSMAKHGSMGAPSATTRMARYTELYYAIEARGQFWLTNRFSIVASVPLVNNYQAVDKVRYADVYTVGDPIIMGRYVVLSSRMIVDSSGTRRRLTIGAGAKLPLAQHDVQQYGRELDHDLQPSTGTWDALLSAEYSMRGRRWGMSIGAIGRYNGTDAMGMRMGHSMSATTEVFRVVKLNKWQWLPSIGAYTEQAMQDRTNGMAEAGTGGSVLFSQLGSRLWWRAFGFSLAWQHALVNGEGAVMIPNRERVLAGITYNFNSK